MRSSIPGRIGIEKSCFFIISTFPMCYSRIHGNRGINKLVSLRHLLLSFLSDFILLKRKIKPSSYGLVENFTWYAKCLEGSNKSWATFFCVPTFLTSGWMICFTIMVCPLRARRNPHWYHQRHILFICNFKKERETFGYGLMTRIAYMCHIYQ